MRRDCTRVSLIEDRRNEHGRQRRDRHTPYVHTYVPHVLRRALDPLSPARCYPSYPFDAPDHPFPPPPHPFLRMHVLAETANEGSSFL